MAITVTQPQQRLFVDWEGYLNLPSELTHYEIIDGEVKPLASPTFKHQLIVRQLILIEIQSAQVFTVLDEPQPEQSV